MLLLPLNWSYFNNFLVALWLRQLPARAPCIMQASKTSAMRTSCSLTHIMVIAYPGSPTMHVYGRLSVLFPVLFAFPMPNYTEKKNDASCLLPASRGSALCSCSRQGTLG